MDVKKEYEILRKEILERIPDTFTVNNNLIEEQSYNAMMLPINFDPYKQNGCYYPTFYEFMPRTYAGEPPRYKMSKGEETTIGMWNAMIQYKEYDFLADLFILGFLHDNWQSVIKTRRSTSIKTRRSTSIAGCLYTQNEIKLLWTTARDVLINNHYGMHDRRCKRYLTTAGSSLQHKYDRLARNGELKVDSAKTLAQIMMEIITDAYSSLYFIIECPDEQSIEHARNVHTRAADAMFSDLMAKAEEMMR